MGPFGAILNPELIALCPVGGPSENDHMDGQHLTKEQWQHSPAKRSPSDAVNRNRTTLQKILQDINGR